MAKIKEEMVYGVNEAPIDASKGDSSTAETVQAKNMQTTTTVGENIPVVDTEKFENRIKFTQNGDIKDSSSNSVVAQKMVETGLQYQCSKAVVNPFPATGTEYLKTLDFKVSGTDTEN